MHKKYERFNKWFLKAPCDGTFRSLLYIIFRLLDNFLQENCHYRRAGLYIYCVQIKWRNARVIDNDSYKKQLAPFGKKI